MGKFSYKKRKGTRKQTFKNRKKIIKGGDPETSAAPAAPETPAEPPAPEALAPETPATPPATPAPETSETPAPEAPATPAVTAPETPATPPETSETPASETPATPAPETPATPASETSETPAPETPETPAPETQQKGQNTDISDTTGSTTNGSYTSDDAGYQKFIENIKTNPEIINNVVFVNAGLSQIFLKQGDSWTEIKK